MWTKWCGERKGARAPLPSLHREKRLEKAVDSGIGEGGRNEGAEAARAFGARAAWHTREPMLRSRESSISHGSDVQHVGVDKGEGEWAVCGGEAAKGLKGLESVLWWVSRGVHFGSALVVGGGGGCMQQCGIDEWCKGSGGPPALA